MYADRGASMEGVGDTAMPVECARHKDDLGREQRVKALALTSRTGSSGPDSAQVD